MKIQPTKYGRGIFAAKEYQIGDLIEVSPVIILSKQDAAKIDGTILYNYYYSWGKHSDSAAIALGYGSLFNHSYRPSAKYLKVIDKDEIHFFAITKIYVGEEIYINYNGDPSSMKPLWFDVDNETQLQ